MKETPQYADISDAELRDIEAEFGHPLTRELALWFIRNRINREAVARMVEEMDSERVNVPRHVQSVPVINRLKIGKQSSAPKKRCA
jgi:hypothetical protein